MSFISSVFNFSHFVTLLVSTIKENNKPSVQNTQVFYLQNSLNLPSSPMKRIILWPFSCRPKSKPWGGKELAKWQTVKLILYQCCLAPELPLSGYSKTEQSLGGQEPMEEAEQWGVKVVLPFALFLLFLAGIRKHIWTLTIYQALCSELHLFFILTTTQLQVLLLARFTDGKTEV